MRPSVEVAHIEGYRYGCADPHDTQPTTRVHTESGDSRLKAAPIEVSASLIVVFALCRSCKDANLDGAAAAQSAGFQDALLIGTTLVQARLEGIPSVVPN